MKKYILSIAVPIVLFTFMGANAQNHQIGVVGGINIASLDEEDEDYDNRTCIGVGGVIELILGEKFTICFEPMYLQKGAKSDFDDPDLGEVNVEMKFSYIEIPAFFKVNLGTSSTSPYIMAGPTIGIVTSSKLAFSAMGIDLEIDVEDIVESIDYGLGLGGGVNFLIGNNTFFVEARYTLGLADIAKEGEIEIGGEKVTNPDAEVKTRGIQIMAGISMPIGKK